MDPEFPSDTNQQVPPVPIKTYQWEDVRRLRAVGGYPWTYLTKPPLQEEEITAETILRETTPRRSMSRDTSRERSAGHSPTPLAELPQTILNLTSSPGSSRKGGGEEGINIPNFSKEVSLESTEEDNVFNSSKYIAPISNAVNPESLNLKVETKISVSPKGILKRKHPGKLTSKTPSEDSPRNSKCCHPFVEKIKHIADKTLHRPEKSPIRKNVTLKQNNENELQEILTLESSPGTERRMKKTSREDISEENAINVSIKNKLITNKIHIYEDIDPQNAEKVFREKKITFTPETIQELLKTAESIENKTCPMTETDVQDRPERATSETKSGTSQDPSLQIDEDFELEESDHIMQLMKSDTFVKAQREALLLDSDESAEENFNVTITDITDEVEDFTNNNMDGIEISSQVIDVLQELNRNEDILNETGITQNDTGSENMTGWSKTGDHEYEPVGKSVEDLEYPQNKIKILNEDTHAKDDDASSTISQDCKYLQGSHNEVTLDEDISTRVNITLNEAEENDIHLAEDMQREIEDRYFVNTPTNTESRTDCEISTSQVDSSALENLPLKRDSRNKFSASNLENTKQRFRNQTTKLRGQADKLRNRIKNIKKPHFNMPDKPQFERHKFTFPSRPKINFPERAKIKLNFSEKFAGYERPKFSFPDRPKFSLPDRSRFKLPERAKLNFSSLMTQNKETRAQDDQNNSIESESDSKKKTIDFDIRKYPRIFSKVKKEKNTISYPIGRADTPTPPEFATVPRMKNRNQYSENKWQESNQFSAEEPRQYGKYSLKNVNETINIDADSKVEENFCSSNQNSTPQIKDFDAQVHGLQKFTKAQRKKPKRWNPETSHETKDVSHEHIDSYARVCKNNQNEKDIPIQSSQFGVIEEINNDEFFLRKKGISEENIEVGKYLSQEIRDAFRLPANALSQMDEPNLDEDEYLNSDLFVQDLDKSYSESIEAQDIDDKRIMEENDDGYYTFPPVRPKRAKKMKKTFDKSIEFIDASIADSIPILINDEEKYDQEDDFHIPPRGEIDDAVEEENHFVFLHDGLQNLNEYENEIDQAREPPVAPKRSKKIIKELSCSEHGSLLDVFIKDDWTEQPHPEADDIIVHRVEHQYIVPDDFEEFIAEQPVAPERKRSRSRGSRGSCATSVPDDDRTSRGAESLILDTNPQAISPLSISERDLVAAARKSPKYAVVEKHTERNKDLPPRPPAPIRRQRSAKSLGGANQFFTLQGRLRDSSPDSSPPKRPHRNYSTLGPSRPPRKKSTTSLITLDILRREGSSNDVTQYVEIDDDGSEIQRDLQSGEIVSKMKDRPLPPPPIPPRGNKKSKNSNKVIESKEKYEHEIITNTSSISLPIKNEKTKFYETEEVVEIEVSTQTDPLPDDFNFELSDEEPSENQKVIFPRAVNDFENSSSPNCLSNINHDAEILAKGLQKFRESSRPSSRAGRSETPLGRPKISTGRISPTAILVERRISSPTRINQEEQVVTTASLLVQPISDIYDKRDAEKGEPNTINQEELVTTTLPLVQKNNSSNESTELTEVECSVNTERQIITSSDTPTSNNGLIKTELLQVSSLDVANLNVSELQAHKLFVSEIQGLSLSRTSDTNTSSGNIILSGVELAPSLIDEIVHRFTQLISDASPIAMIPRRDAIDASTSSAGLYCEEETQTERETFSKQDIGGQTAEIRTTMDDKDQTSHCRINEEDPPQRPPPPFYPYLADFSLPSSSFYRLHSSAMERPFTEFYQGDAIPGPSKRRKPRPVRDSSSDEEEYRPSPRKPHHRNTEPSVSELGGQFVRACQNSISRTVRGILNYIMEHFTGRDGKKDVQMALVIFLVLIAGLIMLGVGDRTVHHHHWEFFNPPTDPNT